MKIAVHLVKDDKQKDPLENIAKNIGEVVNEITEETIESILGIIGTGHSPSVKLTKKKNGALEIVIEPSEL